MKTSKNNMLPMIPVSSSSIYQPDDIVSNTDTKNDTSIKNENVEIKIISKPTKRKSDRIQVKSSKSKKRSKNNQSNIIIQISFLNKSKSKSISKQIPVKTKSKSKSSSSSSTLSSSSNLSIDQLQAEFRKATILLGKIHPNVIEKNNERQTILESCGMRESITDSIISTMLSQNTTDKNSKAAWKQLKQQFPTWESVLELDETDLSSLETSIRIAGLAKTRALRIYQLLHKCKQSHSDNKPCFQYLKQMSTKEIKDHLSQFKGLGPKTISCVLLFGLDRAEFPVDTHVLRISKSMDWLSSKDNHQQQLFMKSNTNKNKTKTKTKTKAGEHTRESAYEYMNSIVPDDIKMDLHCLLVSHGKQCHHCAANHRPQFPPKDGSKLICPLKQIKQMRVKMKAMDSSNKQGLCHDWNNVEKKPIPQIVISNTQIKSEFIPDRIKSSS